MSRSVFFDSPFLLGFEQTRSLIDRAAKIAAEGYPPYNVEAVGDDGVRISLAVAGFSPDQLSVTVEGRQLTISGRRDSEPSAPEGAYLHRGIAARGFNRAFVLADGMEVVGATVEHGLLHVDLTQPPASQVVRQIPIRAG
ncbi:Hsp20 family protein [Brevundimonas aveniformis]|uniref:Hsp20 family protein n=1 Tax=Brevundimonas aveniformis TaxID=370977 RepID=UPI002493CB8C|nr:Hsp20 family protein [Brevundimonas aveniformis]